MGEIKIKITIKIKTGRKTGGEGGIRTPDTF